MSMESTVGPDGRAAAQHVPLALAWADALFARWQSFGMLGLSEARLAAMGVAAMVFFAALAAMLGFTAWLALNGLIVLAVISLAGAPAAMAIAAVALINAAAAWFCWSHALGLTRHMEFPQTRRVLDAIATNHAEASSHVDR